MEMSWMSRLMELFGVVAKMLLSSDGTRGVEGLLPSSKVSLPQQERVLEAECAQRSSGSLYRFYRSLRVNEII
jgi:hypothetical protein